MRKLRSPYLEFVQQDWAANAGAHDSRLILLWFRSAQWAARRPGLGNRIFVAFYRLFTSLFIGIEFPVQAVIGAGLRVHHPHGIVVHPKSRLGADCILRQGVTIGNTIQRGGAESRAPRIGDGVEFGAGCVVIGPVTIGSHARIGALAVVLKDVPVGGVVVGNPGRIVRVEPTPPLSDTR